MMHERYSILSNVPIGILICDEYLRVVFWNQCIADWTGRLPMEAE